MTPKEVVQEGVKQAEKELREKQVGEVKRIVLKTLEEVEKLDKEISKLQQKRKVLKMDLDDLKEGRLDRIAERQSTDEEAKKSSVVVIIKEKEVIREVSPWYWPYQVIWQIPAPQYPQIKFGSPVEPTIWSGANTGDNSQMLSGHSTSDVIDITCSVAKDSAVGAYKLGDSVVHLR